MPSKSLLSCLFAAALASNALAQDAADPPAPAPEAAAEPAAEAVADPSDPSDQPDQPASSPNAETETPATDPSPEAAADAVAMPSSTELTASDGNPLFAEPVDTSADSMPLFDDLMFDEPETEQRFQRSRTAIANDQLRLRVKLRQAKTKAERDDAVVAARAAVDAATTFPERRNALKAYYKVLDEKIVKLDPSVKELAEERSKLALQKLEQRRLAGKKPKDAEIFAD